MARIITTLLSLVTCAVILSLSTPRNAVVEAQEGSESAQETPKYLRSFSREAWIPAVVQDSAEATHWNAPYAKGHAFASGHTASLTNDGRFDPLWNLRSLDQWPETSLFLYQGDSWLRTSAQQATGQHADNARRAPGNYALTYTHSPLYGFGLQSLSFQQVPGTLGPEGQPGQPSYRTLLNMRSGQPALTHVNLVDAASVNVNQFGNPGGSAGDWLLFRAYPEADERSALWLSRLNTTEQFTASVQAPQRLELGEGFHYFSRPVWISEQSFAVIRAANLSEQRSEFQNAEVVLVTLDAMGNSMQHVLDRGSYPVETSLDAITHDAKLGRLLLIRAGAGSDGKQRSLRVLNLRQMQEVRSDTYDLGPWNALNGVASVSGQGTQAMIAGRTYRINADGSMSMPASDADQAAITLGDQPARGFKSAGSGVALAFTAVEAGARPAFADFAFLRQEGRRSRPGDPYIDILHNRDRPMELVYSGAQLRDQLLPTADLAARNGVIKRVNELGINLRSTVVIYDLDVKDGDKQVKAKAVELYRLTRRGGSLRTEDNIGGSWAIRAWDGQKARIADDVEKTFIDAGADVSEKLQSRLRLRRMLLLSDAASVSDQSLLWLTRDQVALPSELAGETPVSVDCHLFASIETLNGVSQESVFYWFDASKPDLPLVKARLSMALGGEQRQEIDLFFGTWSELKELRAGDVVSSEPGLPVPGVIYGYHPHSRVLRLTMRMEDQLTRASSSAPIRSGYNWARIDADDFGVNYQLDQ